MRPKCPYLEHDGISCWRFPFWKDINQEARTFAFWVDISVMQNVLHEGQRKSIFLVRKLGELLRSVTRLRSVR